MRILRLRALRTANVGAALMLGAMGTLFFFASLFMQQVMGYDALRTGLAYVPLAVAVIVGAGLAAGPVAGLPARAVLAVGLALATAGLLLLARLPVGSGYAGGLLPPFLLVGAGLGMSFVPLQIAAAFGVDARDSGVAAGLINTSQEAGGAVGVAVVSTAAFTRIGHTVSGHSAQALRAARASGFHEAFLVGAGFAFAALLVALLLPPLRTEG
jgi:hypothetical protein